MSKLKEFVEQVEAQEALPRKSVVIEKSAAIAVKNVAKNALERAIKGGQESGKNRILSDDPKKIARRIYMREFRRGKRRRRTSPAMP